MEIAIPAAAGPLPPGSTLDIRVVEVSGPDRAIVGSLTSPEVKRGSEYKVECKASRIREQQSYGLEVTVVAEGKALLRNAKPYYVLTRGNPDRATVELQPMR